MASKKEEEDAESNLTQETSQCINALKSNNNNQSGFNAAMINLLENYNGKNLNCVLLSIKSMKLKPYLH